MDIKEEYRNKENSPHSAQRRLHSGFGSKLPSLSNSTSGDEEEGGGGGGGEGEDGLKNNANAT